MSDITHLAAMGIGFRDLLCDLQRGASNKEVGGAVADAECSCVVC